MWTPIDNVSLYLLWFDMIINELRLFNHNVPNDEQFLHLMKCLPKHLEHVADTLITVGNNDLQNARNTLRHNEARANRNNSNILKMESEEKGRKNFKRKADQKDRPKTCSYCRKPGHECKECFRRKKDEILDLFLPNQDAPWRSNAIKAIEDRISEACSKF